MDKNHLFLSLMKHVSLHGNDIESTVRFNHNDGNLEMFFISYRNSCFHASRCDISKEGVITHHFLSGCSNPSGFVTVSEEEMAHHDPDAEVLVQDWVKRHQGIAKSGASTVALLEWLGLVKFQ